MTKSLFLMGIALLSGFLFPGYAQLRVYEDGKQKTLELSPDRESLLRYYVSQGYFSARIDSLNEDIAWVSPGCGFEVSSFRFEADDWDETPWTVSYDGQYNSDRVEEVIEQQKGELIKQGFLRAAAELKKLELDEEKCQVSLGVSFARGAAYYSSGIIFEGSHSYSQSYLERISRYQDSTLVSQVNMNRLQRELRSSGLFRNVSRQQIYSREGTNEVYLLYGLQERSLNQLDGLLGYAPDASGTAQIVGNLNLSLWNLLTEGNGFDLSYQRLRPETSRLSMGVSQHWLGNLPVGLDLGFSIYQNDSTYQTRSLEMNAFYDLTQGFRLRGGIQSFRSSTNLNPGITTEPDGRKQGGRLGFVYDQLDRPEIPRSGYQLSLDLGIYNKDIDSDSAGSYQQQQLSGKLEFYIPLAGQSVLASDISWIYMTGDQFTESDLIRFGGAKSFRGYGEEQFQASQLIWSTLEYRFFTGVESFLFGFTSIGGYFRPVLINEAGGSFDQSDLLMSTGFGLSYRTRIGRFSFTYAISPQESIGNGKVHVGIITSL